MRKDHQRGRYMIKEILESIKVISIFSLKFLISQVFIELACKGTKTVNYGRISGFNNHKI